MKLEGGCFITVLQFFSGNMFQCSGHGQCSFVRVDTQQGLLKKKTKDRTGRQKKELKNPYLVDFQITVDSAFCIWKNERTSYLSSSEI